MTILFRIDRGAFFLIGIQAHGDAVNGGVYAVGIGFQLEYFPI